VLFPDLVGDAVAACAHWQMIALPPAAAGLACIDVLCVADMYRGAGRGRALLLSLLADQLAQAEGTTVALCGAALRLPRRQDLEWFAQKAISYGFVPAEENIVAAIESTGNSASSGASVCLFLTVQSMRRLLTAVPV
jgi:GNAT superfamily N-acetyltransferase